MKPQSCIFLNVSHVLLLHLTVVINFTNQFCYLFGRKVANVFPKVGSVIQKLTVDQKTLQMRALNVCILRASLSNTLVTTKDVFSRITFVTEKMTALTTLMRKIVYNIAMTPNNFIVRLKCCVLVSEFCNFHN